MSSDEPKWVTKEEILQETRREFRKNRKREGWQKKGNEYDSYRSGPLVAKKKQKKEKRSTRNTSIAKYLTSQIVTKSLLTVKKNVGQSLSKSLI